MEENFSNELNAQTVDKTTLASSRSYKRGGNTRGEVQKKCDIFFES